MKVYKIEIMVIDFDECGESYLKELLNQISYPPLEVKRIESRDIGEWSEDHPLNSELTDKDEYTRLFSN